MVSGPNRMVLVGMTALALALTPVAFRDAQAESTGVKLEIPYQAAGVGVLPLWTAINSGLFQKYGVEATTQFIAQSPTLVASMLSGEIPFANVGEDAVIAADLHGGDIVILASGPNKIFFTVYAAPGIRRVEDLKGKKIGISQFGATTDFAMRYILSQAGLRPGEDATLLAIGNQANNLTALQRGVIDATIMAPPATLKARQLGYHRVADMLDYGLLFYTSTLAGKKSWIAAHPAETLNVVRGYVAGIATVRTDKPAALAALAKYTDTKEPDLLEESYTTLVKTLPRNPVPEREALEAQLKNSKEPAAKTADPASFIDASFVDRLQNEGFIDRLYK
jgi:NitT/TauT family transport system substrate-binding protein